MEETSLLLIEIIERVMPNPRGGLPIRSYQGRLTDRRFKAPHIMEFKVHLTVRGAAAEVLDRIARTM